MVESLSLQAVLIIVLALVAGGFIKGITGMGLPMVAIPVLAIFLGVEHAVIVMVFPVMALNAWLVWRHRDCANQFPEMPRLLLAGCVGAPLGAWFLVAASDRVLSAILSAWLVVYILLRFLHPNFSLSLRSRYRLSPLTGFCSGALQAATGMSAPAIATYFHALKLEPRAYIYAVATPFLVMSVVQFATLVSLGVYTSALLLESLLAAIPAMLVIPLGASFAGKIKKQVFDNIILGLLITASIRLLYSAIWGG
ncbi:MAG: sulfite exporter TauE/SafE family protein [Acidobacteria bacterium]|nr:sulfite exporter TauE/SafE family protein [Acidobacteriota bacterium]